MPRIHRILFASDFSPASRKAFATAKRLAAANRATLTLLHVIVPFSPIGPEPYIDSRTWDEINTQARRWSQQQLGRLATKAKTAGVRVTSLLREGDPAREIARVSRTLRADFLVIGTHGRTGLTRLLLGSVAGRVVATASCPVITVRSR